MRRLAVATVLTAALTLTVAHVLPAGGQDPQPTASFVTHGDPVQFWKGIEPRMRGLLVKVERNGQPVLHRPGQGIPGGEYWIVIRMPGPSSWLWVAPADAEGNRVGSYHVRGMPMADVTNVTSYGRP